jgi:putative flippase GtrA
MPQILVFLIVGVLNTAFGYGVIFAAMYLAGLSPVASNVIGYSVGLIVSYVLHRTFTFKSASKSRTEPVKFLLVFLLAYLANLATLVLLIDHFGLHEALSQVGAGAVYVVSSFLFNKHYVFRGSSSEPDANIPSSRKIQP